MVPNALSGSSRHYTFPAAASLLTPSLSLKRGSETCQKLPDIHTGCGFQTTASTIPYFDHLIDIPAYFQGYVHLSGEFY